VNEHAAKAPTPEEVIASAEEEVTEREAASSGVGVDPELRAALRRLPSLTVDVQPGTCAYGGCDRTAVAETLDGGRRYCAKHARILARVLRRPVAVLAVCVRCGYRDHVAAAARLLDEDAARPLCPRCTAELRTFLDGLER
jgi:hypothetical protein